MNENAFFVTGTDTDVGKTVVSAALCQHLGAAYWKPVQAGSPSDSDRVRQLVDVEIVPERYVLKAPMSPHAAASLEGRHIRLSDFQLPRQRPLIVEGAGGLMVPLNNQELMIDLIELLQLPVVLVARSGLGTLNHTLLSLEALQRRQIPIAGVVLNGPEHPSNRETLAAYVPILGHMPPLEELNAQSLHQITGVWHDFDSAHLAPLYANAGALSSTSRKLSTRSEALPRRRPLAHRWDL